MARALTEIERRHASRVTPTRTPWKALALLRPGQEVALLNVSKGGALVESRARMLPGSRTELQLTGVWRHSIRGRIDRCRVIAVNPMRYEGAIVFEQPLEIAEIRATSSQAHE